MKKCFSKFFAVFLTVVMALNFSCKENEDAPTLSLGPTASSIMFAANGQEATLYLGDKYRIPTFKVETNQGPWNVNADMDWVKISIEGNTFTLSAKPNTTLGTPEDAELTITAGNAKPVILGVKQMAGDPSLEVLPEVRTIVLSADGQTVMAGNEVISSFNVFTNVDEWTVVSNKAWLIITKDADNDSFTLSAAANICPSTPEARATIMAGTATAVVINVIQEPNPNVLSKYADIINPYEGIKFSTTLNLRSQLHVHSTASDGELTADNMVSAYVQRNYDVVAITDHDHMDGRDFGPMAYGKTEYKTVSGKNVLVIQGLEISNYAGAMYGNVARELDHFNNFFVVPESKALPRQKGMKVDMDVQIQGTDGIMILCHPWRCEWTDPIAFYTDFFKTFPADRLIGLEIGNKAGGEPGSGSILRKYDWEIWDAILTTLAPGRNIFGFATDDSHRLNISATSFFGLRWTELLVPENTIPNVKEAMRNGRSFFVHNTTNSSELYVYNLEFPSVKNIIVDKDKMTITVNATGYTKIEWISGGKTVLTNQTTLSPDDLDMEKYVRFVLTGANGTLYSQPFLLVNMSCW